MNIFEVEARLESDTVTEAEVVGAIGWQTLKGGALFKKSENSGFQTREIDLGNGRKRRMQSCSSPAGLKAISGLYVGKSDMDAAELAGGW